MIYYPKKEEAEEVRARVMLDPRILDTAVQFEPYNGWVVVVIPKRIACEDLAEFCEVRDGQPRPIPDKIRPVPLPPKEARAGGTPSRPGGGVTKRVWAIADEQGGDRAATMAACIAEGINKATAATQFAKWRKSK